MNDFIVRASELLSAQIVEGAPAWAFFVVALTLLSAFYLIRAWIYKNKRGWESFNFILFCAPVFACSACNLLEASSGLDGAMLQAVNILDFAAYTSIPAFICLHIWSQVSYKPISAFAVVRYFLIPAVLTASMVVNTVNPNLGIYEFTELNFTWEQLLGGIYLVFMLARCYLLCFNVFYQMPRHMRRSTYYMLIAVSSIALSKTLWLFIPDEAAFIFENIAFAIAMERFFSAFYIANSSNVIVTSREFVFSNLSTVVLTVSRKGRILDWNKRDEHGMTPLPKPHYKQSIEKYREAFIEEGHGKVSSHDPNIVTATFGGVERHYMFLNHEIRHKARTFGYLVEISEVTNVYSVLRYFEEIAMIDQLTGMYNRNMYMNMASSLVSDENMPLTVVVGDVNNLKQMNDTVGHLCGDRLLTTITSIVCQEAPEGAFSARIGGDELALLIPKSGEPAALEFMEKVNARCSSINDLEFGKPSISWGYAVMRSTAEDYNDIFSKADAMMYERKKQIKEGRSSGFVPSGRAAARRR